MLSVFITTVKGQKCSWGWSAQVPIPFGVQRDFCGIAHSETDALLSAALSSLHFLLSNIDDPQVCFITHHAGFVTIINQGFTKWSQLSQRKELAHEAFATSPIWRKLAKASKRFVIKATTPVSSRDFELLGRGEYYAQCGLGNNKLYKIYTDGSYFPKSGAGGWAAIIEDGKSVYSLSGAMYCKDCNEAELMAVIRGLSVIQENASAIVFTDSRFVVAGSRQMDLWATSNWKTPEKKRVPYRDMWSELLAQYRRVSARVEWIKGHSGISMNYRADLMAKRAAKSLRGESKKAFSA